MGGNEHSLVTGCCYIWRVSIESGSKFGVESCQESLEQCSTLSLGFIYWPLYHLGLHSPFTVEI